MRFAMLMILLSVPGAALSAVPASAADQKKGEELYCRNEARSGTRFAKKICISRAEREARQEQIRKDYSETRDRPIIARPCGPGC